MVVFILWVRSQQATIQRQEKLLDAKDAENAALAKQVVSLATDVQRSLRERSGCRWPGSHQTPDHLPHPHLSAPTTPEDPTK